MSAAPWHRDNELRHLIGAIQEAGAEARLVGGCVRDWLLDRPIHDIDVATTMRPETTMGILIDAGLQVIPTGIAHGTVTAIYGDRNFEVTTLRDDLETDGRHAVVGFTTSWVNDARRRDFTINALYSDIDGTIYDPLDLGQQDLSARVLRFVGDPEARIHEDYLRILRFHRFASQIEFGQDQAGLAACARLADNLSGLSAERIWQEMGKLLEGPGRWQTLKRMQSDGVLDPVLPEALLNEWVRNLPGDDAVLLLAALTGEQAGAVARRWKLSRRETRRLQGAAAFAGKDAMISDRDLQRLAWQIGRQAALDRLMIATAFSGTDRNGSREMLLAWQFPEFPLKGQDALDAGLTAGPRIGVVLKKVERWWLDRDFKPDRDACLRELRSLTNQS
jgi:poly(A) polymerase